MPLCHLYMYKCICESLMAGKDHERQSKKYKSKDFENNMQSLKRDYGVSHGGSITQCAVIL